MIISEPLLHIFIDILDMNRKESLQLSFLWYEAKIAKRLAIKFPLEWFTLVFYLRKVIPFFRVYIWPDAWTILNSSDFYQIDIFSLNLLNNRWFFSSLNFECYNKQKYLEKIYFFDFPTQRFPNWYLKCMLFHLYICVLVLTIFNHTIFLRKPTKIYDGICLPFNNIVIGKINVNDLIVMIVVTLFCNKLNTKQSLVLVSCMQNGTCNLCKIPSVWLIFISLLCFINV